MKNKGKNFKGLDYILFGVTLLGVALGSMFSIELVKYGYWILLLSCLLLVNYVFDSPKILMGGKMKARSFWIGFVGIGLLVLFLGIQSPQVPFKIWILGVGGVFVGWGLWKGFR